MLTHISIKNFKIFGEASVDLGESVVLIGPNNSGKTTTLQALTLWKTGLEQWMAKRGGNAPNEKRKGVTINRTDLISLPVPSANLLWHNLHSRNIRRENGKPITSNVRIDIVVKGISDGEEWECGLEFDYANDQSFYCRPLRLSENGSSEIMPIPDAAKNVKVAFLPAMSGLAATEPKAEQGRIDVLLGEGQTAQVLRNLCYKTFDEQKRSKQHMHWDELKEKIHSMFGYELLDPQYIESRGEITMSYKDLAGITLDISASGRGFQQTLLLLAHLYANPATVLLLDEPDAHLEVLRQKEIYHTLTDLAAKQNAQIIAASHSEIILNEAAEKNMVVAFVGKPHRIDSNNSQVMKSLKSIGFDQYYQAEQTGWVLYLEGATDLYILREFAEKLGHPLREHLERPFVEYVGNHPKQALFHFWGLREAKNDLFGFALFDNLGQNLPPEINEKGGLAGLQWTRCEIENYFCNEEVLLAYARDESIGNLFKASNESYMKEAIAEIAGSLKNLGIPDPWSPDLKVTDKFLDHLFEKYFGKIKVENQLRKTNYHILARFLSPEDIDREVVEKLDAIHAVAKQAKPL